jgi:hypothetical protein
MSEKTTHEIQNTDEELVFYCPKKGLKFAANKKKVFIELNESQEYINECADAGPIGCVIYDRDVWYHVGIYEDESWNRKKRSERMRTWENADSLRTWLRRIEFENTNNYELLSRLADERSKEWMLYF